MKVLDFFPNHEYLKQIRFDGYLNKLNNIFLSLLPFPSAAEIPVAYLEYTPVTDDDVLSGSADVENDNDDDITGGNLGMLEDTLSELSGEKHEGITDEFAYDIRPNKIQPLNEMVCF